MTIPKMVKETVNFLAREGFQKAKYFFRVDNNERLNMNILDHFSLMTGCHV